MPSITVPVSGTGIKHEGDGPVSTVNTGPPVETSRAQGVPQPALSAEIETLEETAPVGPKHEFRWNEHGQTLTMTPEKAREWDIAHGVEVPEEVVEEEAVAEPETAVLEQVVET